MRKILVTGSNGLLGQKITDLILKRKDLAYVATSRGENRHPVQEGYEYKSMDLCVQKELEQVIHFYQPDVLINTAAMANVDACERDPDSSFRINVEAVKQLIRLCEKNKIHLIHLSTDFVFDGEAGPYTEEDVPNPLSTYGRHKAEAERLIQAANCPWSIVRTILVYGVVVNLSRSNVVLWAKDALENKREIRVVNDQWRMPTLAEDLAEACLSIARLRAEGIFHISGKDLFNIAELVEAVAEHYGLDASYIRREPSVDLHQNAVRPRYTGFILDKAYERLGYIPRSFGEGLRLLDEQWRKWKSE